MKPYYNRLIGFDCERMRHRHCGLYSFCRDLGYFLIKEGEKRGQLLNVYTTKNAIGALGNKAIYLPQKSLHKFFFKCGDGIKLWHSTYQLSKYRPYNIPIMMTIHDLNFLYEESDERIISKSLRQLQRNIDRAVRIVAISEFTKKDILKNLDTRGREIDVIYNGCSIYTGEVCRPRKIQLKPFLFSIGTILPKKNFHVLPCLLRNNDYDLIIAGSYSEYSNYILREADKYGVGERVKIIGNIAEAEKHWYYQNCEAFLFPSIAEGFGLPVIEAMYYGKPIFLSSHTCLPEIGQEHAFYFNYDFDPDLMCHEFEQGMQSFYIGDKDVNLMKKHALSFSWESAAFHYWNIYEEIISNIS